MRADKIPPNDTLRVPFDTPRCTSISVWVLATHLVDVRVIDDEHLKDFRPWKIVPNRFESNSLLQHESLTFRPSRQPWSLIIMNKNDVEVTVQYDVKTYVVDPNG